ncbi:MAG: hypothetical protein K2H85_08475 [Allobaculum sp.]|nr:hypothetical protein [Allobaculum sp.]
MISAQSTKNAMEYWPKTKVISKSSSMVPRWVNSDIPKPKSQDKYDIIRADAEGKSLDEARLRARASLTHQLATDHDIKIYESDTDWIQTNDNVTFDSNQVYEKKIGDTSESLFKCQVIDEYWEQRGNTYYVVDLFAATNYKGEIPDRFEKTTSYGVAPVFYSLIPGVGQMYKGNTVKGGVILGSAVVVGAGIITAESMRSSYIKKMKEYPKHHDFYNNKATTWRNVRNVTLGVGAGLYLYNLIDAAIAPGRRKVNVSKKYSYQYSFAPIWNGDNMELAFTLAF